jgi:HEAT repeat protein
MAFGRTVLAFGLIVALHAAAMAQQPPVPVAGPPGLRVGDMITTSSERCVLQDGPNVVAILPRGVQLRVVALNGDWVGCSGLFYGTEQKGWIAKWAVVKDIKAGTNQLPTAAMTNNSVATNASTSGRASVHNTTAIETSPEVNRLIGDLQSSDAKTRALAAIAIGNMGDASVPAIPYLIRLLDDDTTLQWWHGAARLGTTSPSKEAGLALGKIGKPALEAIISLHNNTESPELLHFRSFQYVRLVVMNIRDARALDILIQLLSSEDGCYRCGAARALGNIKDRRAVPALINALQNGKDEGIRSSAAIALGDVGAPDAIEPLIRSLNDTTVVATAAATALGQLKDATAVEPMITALNSTDPGLRVAAAKALGKLRDERAVSPLINAFPAGQMKPVEFSDRNYEYVENMRGLQIAILEALGDIADPRATDFLVSVWHSDHSSHAFGTGRDIEGNYDWGNIGPIALTALGRIGGATAVSQLILALRDEHYWIQASAAQALGKSKDARAIDPLISVLLRNRRRMAGYSDLVPVDQKLSEITSKALSQITGMRFDDPEEWKRWRESGIAPPSKSDRESNEGSQDKLRR